MRWKKKYFHLPRGQLLSGNNFFLSWKATHLLLQTIKHACVTEELILKLEIPMNEACNSITKYNTTDLPHCAKCTNKTVVYNFLRRRHVDETTKDRISRVAGWAWASHASNYRALCMPLPYDGANYDLAACEETIPNAK